MKIVSKKTKKPTKLEPKKSVWLNVLDPNLVLDGVELMCHNTEEALSPKMTFSGLTPVLRQTEDKGGLKRSTGKGLGKFGNILNGVDQMMQSKDALKQDKATIELLEKVDTWLIKDGKKIKLDDPTRKKKRKVCQCIKEQSELAAEYIELKLLRDKSQSDSQQYLGSQHKVLTISEEVIEKRKQQFVEDLVPLRAKGRKIQADLTLTFGSAKKPSAKSNSDSFLIWDSNGTPQYMFKPQEGELDLSKDGWPQGGGAPRECIFSALNDTMKTSFGIDFGVTPTTCATLESDIFQNGEKSQATKRTGALQDAIDFDEKADDDDLFDELAKKPGDIQKWKKTIRKEDVQQIALLDFVTLNLDRNPGNVLIKKLPGNKRQLIPIDAGFALPPRDVFDKKAQAIYACPGDLDGPPEQANFLLQLEQAQEPFDEGLLQKIDLLDPEVIAGTLVQTEKGLPGQMRGTIPGETVNMVKASVNFLKTVLMIYPKLPVITVSWLYANVFPGYLIKVEKGVQPNDLFLELQTAVAKGIEIVRQEIHQKQSQVEYKKAGGQLALANLGFNEKDYPDVNERIQLIKAKKENPVAIKHLVSLLQKMNLSDKDMDVEWGKDYTGQPIGVRIRKAETHENNLQSLLGHLNELNQTVDTIEQLLDSDPVFKGQYKSLPLHKGINLIVSYKSAKKNVTDLLGQLKETDESMTKRFGNKYSQGSLAEKLKLCEQVQAEQDQKELALILQQLKLSDQELGEKIGKLYVNKPVRTKLVQARMYVNQQKQNL